MSFGDVAFSPSSHGFYTTCLKNGCRDLRSFGLPCVTKLWLGVNMDVPPEEYLCPNKSLCCVTSISRRSQDCR